MTQTWKTVILRHPKEKLSKCSLQPLVHRQDIEFIKAKPNLKFNADGYILLAVDCKELSQQDAGSPLLLLDSTWRLLHDLEKCITGNPIKRSLPKSLKTAYPRISKTSQDPLGGLASVEALYAAWRLLGKQDDSLLKDYYWKNEFLSQYSK